MLRRLPISLRFDDEVDSDFYYGFIEQKKNDRELSSLILDLLHVYYENALVREAVDSYTVSKSPFMHIHEELQRIATEHNKQRVSASMLGDFTNNARKQASEPLESVPNEPFLFQKEPSNTEELPQFMLPSNLEPYIFKMVQESLTKLKDSPQQNAIEEINSNKPSVVSVDAPVIPIETPIETTVDITTPSLKVVEKKMIKPPVFQHGNVTAPIIDGVLEEIVDTVVKKPKSFGKLLNSVK